jgi:UDP-2-acetamido-3-amino-2,3-dideoxy-glucuronate N-acetyltransferase
MDTTVMPSAEVDPRARIGLGSIVWHLAQIREGAKLGEGCIVGRGVYIDTGVHIGCNCKLENYALVFAPAELGDGVFIGPAAVLTNDVYPRAVTADGNLKRGQDWKAVGVTVREGASIGARAVVIGGVAIGRWALVGAGAVVTHDVPDHALAVGVPARQVGWVGRVGVPLRQERDGTWRCPQDGTRYAEQDGQLVER